MSLIVNAVGTAAALASMTSFLPQIAKIWRERDASSVSLRMYAVTVTGFSLWIAYGIMTHAWPVTAANSVCLVLSATILVLKWRFANPTPSGVAREARGVAGSRSEPVGEPATPPGTRP